MPTEVSRRNYRLLQTMQAARPVGRIAGRHGLDGIETSYQPNWMVAPVRPLPFCTAWPLVFLPNWNRP